MQSPAPSASSAPAPRAAARSRRHCAALCAGALLLALALGGCRQQEVAEHTPVDWQNVSDEPAQTLEFSWMGPLSFDRGRPGSWIQQQIEERFNLRLKPIFIDQVSYARTRSLRFVAGDIPDVFWNGDPLVAQRMARHGFVLQLPREVILKHAPDYARYIQQQAPEAWLYPSWQGENWGVPTVVPSGHYPMLALWRKDWLDKVGIEKVPETLDEMHEAFRRFKERDPDGNGRNDTYAISPPIHHWSLFFAEFFATQGVLPFDLQLVDGKIVWGGTRPEAKEVLAMLRQWYSEGLISPDFVLGSHSSHSEQQFVEGRVGYYGNVSVAQYLNHRPASSLHNRLRQINPQAELVAGPLPAGADGQRRARVWGGGGHILQFSKALEAQPQKVIRVLHMLNEAARNPELATEMLIGKRGLHWDFNEANGLHELSPYVGGGNDAQLTGTSRIGSVGFFMVAGLPPETLSRYRTPEENAVYTDLANPQWGISNALGKTDVLESSGQSLADLRLLQMRYYTEIIRGNMPLDAFETFTAQWLERGGREILEEANELLRQRDAVYLQIDEYLDSPSAAKSAATATATTTATAAATSQNTATATATSQNTVAPSAPAPAAHE